jgi:hypothetical protein
MTKKKTTLAEYGGLADLAAARQGRGATPEQTPRPAPETSEAPDVQISAFVPGSTYRRVKVALAEDGLTMRALICQLLDEWLAKR